RIRRHRRANITAAPTDQTAENAAIAGPLKKMAFCAAAPMSGVNQPKREGHNRSGARLSGNRKLSDVATQIQYFAVAVPRCIDVSSQAAIQTIEAYRRWISIECASCSFMAFPSLPAGGSGALKSLEVFQR